MFDHHLREAVESVAWKYRLDPEDLYQDMALALLEKGFTEQTLAAKGGRRYLFTMAQNRAYNLKRAEQKAVTADLSETGEDPTDLGSILTETTDGGMTHPQEDLEQAEALEVIRSHVYGVVEGSRYGDALAGFYLDGLEQRDVGKALGISQDNAKYRLHMGRKEVGVHLADLRIWRTYIHPGAKRSDGVPEAACAELRAKAQL